jgi:hypothetical protein
MVLFGMALMEVVADLSSWSHDVDDSWCFQFGLLLSFWYLILVKLDVIAFVLVDIPSAYREARDSHPDYPLDSLSKDLDELLSEDVPLVCETEEELVASLITPPHPLPPCPLVRKRTCWQSCSDALGCLRKNLLYVQKQ